MKVYGSWEACGLGRVTGWAARELMPSELYHPGRYEFKLHPEVFSGGCRPPGCPLGRKDGWGPNVLVHFCFGCFYLLLGSTIPGRYPLVYLIYFI